MPLDNRYVLASDLASYFADKDSGEPLSGGVIKFYKDQARTEPKDVFQISGSPPNYTYTNIGSTITLSGAGLIQNDDTGQIIILMYRPSDDAGNYELYYVTCDSADGVRQWTREGWPNVTGHEEQLNDVVNYAPNGQFLLHNDIPSSADNTYIPGKITQPITVIAPGGWTFERPPGSAATDIVTFERFDSAVTNPSGSPRYYLKIERQAPGSGEAYADICLTFPDVNKFSSTTQKWTYAFTCESTGSGSVTASLILIKNYGTGGDGQEEISLGSVIIPSGGFVIKQTIGGFVFGDNTGKNIGPHDDDFIKLALRLPSGNIFDIAVTDFILTPGDVNINQFPPTPDSEFAYESLAPAIPNYDGSSLYLPLQLTASGLRYDDSVIGEVIAESNPSDYVNSLHPSSNKLLADGSQYETAAYSPLGIPYKRLQKKYWNDTLQVPIYGTGASYFIACINPGILNQIVISNNSAGVVTAAADGTLPTGFTFTNTFTGQASHFDCWAYLVPTNGFHILNRNAGAVTAATAGTSGYSVTTEEVGNTILPQLTAVGPVTPTPAGVYFTFSVFTGGGNFNYYVWYQINGAGTDPAVGGHTGILVNLTGGDTPASISLKTALALNTAGQITSITTVAASAMAGGDYFTINSSGDSYYVWYTKEGTGTDPKLVGKRGIHVDLESDDTAEQVASKTQAEINKKFFSVPDYRGYFLRGLDSTSLVDKDNPSRYSFVPGVITGMVGTIEKDSNRYHAHLYDYTKTDGTPSVAAGGSLSVLSEVINTSFQGEYEARPINKSINYAIRY